MSSHRTLSVLVEDKPGVLTRVAALFSRRGYNIESLAVGPTENEGVSRMTVVVDVDDHILEQITKQLNKLIEVLKIVELEPDAIRRELQVVKVRCDANTRSEILDIVQLFKAKTVDVTPDSITLVVTGNPDKLDSLLSMLEPYGIRELAQSGLVALGRGAKSISEKTRKERVQQTQR
ncbi:acetolactate synthase small subunit [Raineyella fluvialis]|uniref:Acetolactate synthase small subunit n=1 Tax=Raineyella fluvialis TaxID=2662261 RepID=A0A5Q2FGB2_9ACTN|nr:acetolactate synthase small subunit [Raineyella fluvialis]QGF24837.1 acetolactate synthase small subunit [Raineyella fluvialis]